MSEEIQRADPRLRRVAVLMLVGATVAAACVLLGFHAWLVQSMATLTNVQVIARMHVSVGISCTGIGLCLLLLAAYCARIARATLDGARWPPASMRVLADTLVRRGAQAQTIGRLLNVAALVLVVLGFVAALYGWRSFGGR